MREGENCIILLLAAAHFCIVTSTNFLIFLRICHERLEVEPNANSDMDFSKIVKNGKTIEDKTKKQDEMVNRITESNEDNFIDDPDVPPLIWDLYPSLYIM